MKIEEVYVTVKLKTGLDYIKNKSGYKKTERTPENIQKFKG